MSGKLSLKVLRFAYTSRKESFVHVPLLLWADVCSRREPFKLKDLTWKVVLCNFSESKWCMVSWALKSRSPRHFIMSCFIVLLELLSTGELLTTELKMSFSCCDLGSPLAAYFARYSTQAWWSIIIWMSQLALHPWSWTRWWLFNLASFLFVMILALYWTDLSLVLIFSNSNLVWSQRLNGKLKRHLRSDSFSLCFRQ